MLIEPFVTLAQLVILVASNTDDDVNLESNDEAKPLTFEIEMAPSAKLPSPELLVFQISYLCLQS
jgi:hypothetical protein